MPTHEQLLDFNNRKRTDIANSVLNAKIVVETTRKEYETIKADIDDMNAKIEGLTNLNETIGKSIAIFNKASEQARMNAKKVIEEIVTNALRFVAQNESYSFVIEEVKIGQKIGYNFLLKSIVNGVENLQDPIDANGGGFVDIISAAARYAYLYVFSDPKIKNNILILDEPGKMLSEQMSVRFAEYIKTLSGTYGNKLLMVTHNENLMNVANNIFTVHKNNNGKSIVTNTTKEDASFELTFEKSDILDEELFEKSEISPEEYNIDNLF